MVRLWPNLSEQDLGCSLMAPLPDPSWQRTSHEPPEMHSNFYADARYAKDTLQGIADSLDGTASLIVK
jgi:hypothetical protein